jgi:hypothetical protein
VHSPDQQLGPEIDVSGAVYLAAALAEAAMTGDTSAAEIDPGFITRKSLQGRLPELIARVDNILGADQGTSDDEVTSPARVH